jgi:hypothetical protein
VRGEQVQHSWWSMRPNKTEFWELRRWKGGSAGTGLSVGVGGGGLQGRIQPHHTQGRTRQAQLSKMATH